MAVRRYFGIIGSKVLSIWGVININDKLRQNPWESLEEELFQKSLFKAPSLNKSHTSSIKLTQDL